MSLYLLLLLLPAAWLAAQRGGPRAERLAAAGTWLALVLAIGLRREVGGDWDSYLLIYWRAAALPLLEAITTGDAGYMLLSGLAARAGLGIAAVNLMCAMLFATGLVALCRARPMAWLALLIALPVAVTVAATNATRQSVALGLLMWAAALWLRGRRASPAALIAAAIAFHWTAVLLAPLPLLLAVRRRVPSRLLLGGAAAAALALLLLVPAAGTPGGAAARAVPSMLALAVWLATSRPDNEAEARTSAYLAALTLFALILLVGLPLAADRIGYYAVAFQMMVLPAAVARLDGRARLAAAAAVAAVYLGLLAGWLALSEYRHCMLPYRSYLADPAAIFTPQREPLRAGGACAWVQAS